MASSSPSEKELRLKEHPEGVLLPIRAKPRAKRAGLLGTREGALLVGVTTPPEKGKANRAILHVLAQALRVPKSSLEIVQGETRREKVVLLRGLSAGEVLRRLGR